MAAIVDNRHGGAYGSGPMASSPMGHQTVVQDTYGGWMTRGKRAIVFGLIGMSLVLGGFLPAIILISRDWSDSETGGIRGACTNETVVRALTTACFYIFHALLVIPMFIKGDKAHSVYSTDNGLSAFWTTRLAQTAAVLQACGNIIQLALLAWTASSYWGSDGSYNSGSCDSGYSSFHDYLFAMLIIGFVISTLSLLTVHKQYTSAALRFGAGSKAGGAPTLVSAP